ncbi:MAG: proteolytic complex protein LbcA [Wenzhouxiangellaceae bacterium]
MSQNQNAGHAPTLLTALSISLLLVTACARQPVHTEPTAPAGQSAVAPASVAVQEPAPAAPLDAGVMYHVLAGEYLGSQDDLAGAAEQYAQAAAATDHVDIAARASRIAYAVEDYAALGQAAARWVELAPDSMDARKLLALAQLHQGETAEVVSTLRWLLAHSDNQAEAWSSIATLLAAVGDVNKSEPVLSRLLASGGDQADDIGLYGRSLLAYRLGRDQQARELAGQAAARSDNIDVLRWAAQVAHADGDTAAALRYYETALRYAPDDRDLNLAYAELLRRDGRLDEALERLRGMPGESAVWYTAGAYAHAGGRQREALDFYRRLRRYDADGDSEHFQFCGRLAEALELYEDAAACYRQVDSGEYYDEARLRLGYVLAENEATTAAADYFRDLQQDDDQEFVEQAYIAESEVWREAGQHDRALNRLSEGLMRLRGSVNLLYARALAAEDAGDLMLAEQDLRTIIQSDPGNSTALNALGYTLANRTNRYAEALSLIERALAMAPADPATLDSMGWVLFRMGQPEEALPYLQQAFDRDQNAEIAAHLGEVLWQLQRFDEAREVWRQGSNIDANDPVLQETLQRFEVAL